MRYALLAAALLVLPAVGFAMAMPGDSTCGGQGCEHLVLPNSDESMAGPASTTDGFGLPSRNELEGAKGLITGSENGVAPNMSADLPDMDSFEGKPEKLMLPKQ